MADLALLRKHPKSKPFSSLIFCPCCGELLELAVKKNVKKF